MQSFFQYNYLLILFSFINTLMKERSDRSNIEVEVVAIPCVGSGQFLKDQMRKTGRNFRHLPSILCPTGSTSLLNSFS